MNGILVAIIVCAVIFLIEILILLMATKEPLHIHGNSKVLLTLFVQKNEYLKYKKIAKARGYNTIEPYIKDLIEKDIAQINDK